MKRSTRPTTCWGKFGVYGRTTEEEQRILELADEFKQRLADLHHEEYRARVDLRNELFPELLTALIAKEHKYAEIVCTQREITAANSHQRTRRSKTPAREKLAQLKEELKDCNTRVAIAKKRYSEALKASSVKSEGDQYVDILQRDYAKRLEAIEDPNAREFARLSVEFTLKRKELDQEFQNRGLHTSTRADIAASCKPKFKKDGPGTRYEYGRSPLVKPVTTLRVQDKTGGTSLRKLMTEKRGVQLSLVKTNKKTSGEEYIYEVNQQLGTSKAPCWTTYRFKLHKPLPDDVIIQQWLLVVDRWGKRTVQIIVSRDSGFAKPIGEGHVAVDIGWRRVDEGWRVAYLLGEHVDEAVVVPNWVIERFEEYERAQQSVDKQAAAQLERIGRSGKRNPFTTLGRYCEEHPEDLASGNVFAHLSELNDRALRKKQRAIRARNKIYEHVVARIRSLHSHLLLDSIDIAKLKTKIVEAQSKINPDAQRQLQYAAPGTLLAMFKSCGLELVEVDNAGESQHCPRCGADNSTQEDRTQLVRGCWECRKPWDRDKGALVIRFARSGVRSVDMDAARKPSVVMTYVNSLGRKQPKSPPQTGIFWDHSQSAWELPSLT